MKKTLLSVALAFASVFAWADEGMWLIGLIDRLKYSDWQKEGLQLTPEEIYSVNNASLKDAIVSFNGYCTGEVISSQGLILTNHHCGYEKIAELSTVEHDYLKDGYWAKSKDQELKPENLYVRFLIRMDDVTDRIQKKLNSDMSETQRMEAIEAEQAAIEAENNEGGKYVVELKSFFGGNEFYYFVYQDYTDVRFVGAPPSSIGKYGGDTDNWEWPRHTGDFSMFRVYADANGNPAEYSEKNVPLTPKWSLPIRMSGVKPGDFAMTIGYPGSTERYMSSYGIEQAVEVEYPSWITAAKTAMDAMKKHMDAEDKIRIDYASSYSSLANYWKNRIGMIEALNKLNTADKKREYEKSFTDWVNAGGDERIAKYGKVLENLKKYYSESNDYVKNRTFLVRGFLRGSGFALKPFIMGRMFDAYTQQNEMAKTAMLPKIKEEIDAQYETFDIGTEADILADLLDAYVKNTEEKDMLSEIKAIQQQYNGNFSAYVKDMVNNSIFTSGEKVKAAFDNVNEESFRNDGLYKLSNSILEAYRGTSDEQEALKEMRDKNFRLFIDGMRQTFSDKIFYPDANFTMRLSTGKVIGLPENPKRPSDDSENYFTTLKGAMHKYVPQDDEFDMPIKLIQLYNKKDYGKYAAKDGRLHVCFLTDNDITGGNSGSPVIGGNGELIGLAFDGNWEAMSGDIEFEEKLQRTINVDIRYVLFVVDKYAGADNLIKEMNLVW